MTEEPDTGPAGPETLDELFRQAIRYGIEIEADYYGNGQDDERYIQEPAAKWAREAATPAPETEAAWQALIDDLHAEFDQGHMRVAGIIDRHRPAIEREAADARRDTEPMMLPAAMDSERRGFCDDLSWATEDSASFRPAT